VGESAKNGENGFLRVLIADEDDIGAFVAHCEIKKLPYACNIQRITRIDEARDKMGQFNPRLILVGQSYANTGFVTAVRRIGTSLPIICVIKDRDIKRAEELLQTGATDSLFASQMPELARCLDGHLSGKTSIPFYLHAGVPAAAKRFSLNTDRFEAFLRKTWSRARTGFARIPGECRSFGKKVHNGCAQLKMVCAALWKRIKVRSLVKMADLIVSTKSAPLPHASLNGPIEEPTNDLRKARKGGGKTIMDLWSRWPGISNRNSQPLSTSQSEINPQKSEAPEENAEAFRSLELAFKTLFHTSLDGLLLLDNTGAILHANSASCALLGLRAAELLGKKFLDFVPAPKKPEAEAAWEMLLTLASHENDLEIVNARGEPKNIHFRGRTNLWFGVHLLILKQKTAQTSPIRDIATESVVANPA